MRVHSFEKIWKLKDLRRKGYSITELARELLMSKANVWHHVQGIKLTPQRLKILRSKQGGSKNKSLLEWQKAKNHAQKLITSLNSTEKILIAAALYWGEGSKRDCGLSNTDPALIKTFINCLRELGVKKENLSVGLRLYEDLDKKAAINFWSKLIGISPGKIKSINVLKGKKKGKLKYGMCRLRIIKGGYILKLFSCLRSIMEAASSPRSSKDRAPHS